MSKSAISPQDEIWSLIKETRKDIREAQREMKELRISQKETDRQIKATFVDLSASQKELQAAQKETDRGMKELQASQKETDKQLKKTDARFNSQWGKLVESLVEGKLVEVLNERGIEVRQTAQRMNASYTKEDGDVQRKEFDILAVNGSELVAVEVKTVLTPEKVNYFLKAMEDFKKYFPDYKLKNIYGAAAYLRSDAEAHLYAENKGLFVIRATGDSASLMNKKGFKPRAFS